MIVSQLPDTPRNWFPLKAGVVLQDYGLVAFTNDGHLVPIEHKDAVAYAGSIDPQHPEDALDNSNGNDGDKTMPVNLRATFGFAPEALTEPLDLKNENIGQLIFASGQRTLHTTPGKGRLPIGVLIFVGPGGAWNIPEDPNKSYYWVDTSLRIATYRA